MAAGREDFEAFVAARYGALLRTAYLLTGDHHDAEDLLQQSLVNAVGAWEPDPGRPGAVRAHDPGPAERLAVASPALA